ncbi:MAG: membrane dipeptidase [Myxococcota bacterium]|nr:membrane dipeptidase [Myxococcota bacterium]
MPAWGRQRGLTRRDFLVAAGAAAANAAWPRSGSAALSQEALGLHRESAVFDLHIDTLLWQRFFGYDLTKRHEPWLPRSAFFSHMDLPRAAEAGLDGAVLGLVISPSEERKEQLWALKLLRRLERGRGTAQTLEVLDSLQALADENPDTLRFGRTGSELRSAIDEGRFAALAGLEGAHGIEGSLENVQTAWDRGLRMIGLVHFQANAAAHPMTAPAFEDRGLTPFGFDLVARMESLPMVVDLAHLNARGVRDFLAVATRPGLVSHSACQAVHPSPRNLDDTQLRAIADAGGVVGLAVGGSFLGPGGLDAFLAHAEHLRKVAGDASLALGSDWDGAIVPVKGLEDVRGLPVVTDRLLRAGWPPDRVRALLGENALRVITEVLG